METKKIGPLEGASPWCPPPLTNPPVLPVQTYFQFYEYNQESTRKFSCEKLQEAYHLQRNQSWVPQSQTGWAPQSQPGEVAQSQLREGTQSQPWGFSYPGVHPCRTRDRTRVLPRKAIGPEAEKEPGTRHWDTPAPIQTEIIIFPTSFGCER